MPAISPLYTRYGTLLVAAKGVSSQILRSVGGKNGSGTTPPQRKSASVSSRERNPVEERVYMVRT